MRTPKKTQTRQRFIAMSVMAVIAVIAIIVDQSGSSETYIQINQAPDTTIIRVMLALSGFVIGGLLGALFSERAKGFRLILGAVLLGLLFAVALLSGGGPGWSAALMLWFAGFGVGVFAALHFLGKRRADPNSTAFGSARWADADDLTKNGLLDRAGLLLGTYPVGQELSRITYGGDRHLLTVAPTRSGKGTSMILPNLLTYEGSVLVIDPKGENALITADQRRKLGSKVHLVDPWGIASEAGDASRFNPLDWLQPGDVDLTENAMLLADALVIKSSHKESFWAEEAKALLQGVILYVVTDEHEAGQRHLPRVRDLLLLDGEEMSGLFHRMLDSDHHIVASTGARCLQKEEKLLANVIASAQAETHFLDSARLRENLSASDFKFEDLKTRATSIYLVLPADRLGPFSRWLRLLIQQAITVNARNIAVKPAKPVLFILDELPALGRLSMVEQAYGLMAGFGFQLHGVVQDLTQLKSIYGNGWETFIGNSGVIQYFGSRDRTTAEYFSALCGQATVWNISTAIANVLGQGENSTTQTTSETRRPLAFADELMRLESKDQLILIENHHPIQAQKMPWYMDSEIKDLGNNLQSTD